MHPAISKRDYSSTFSDRPWGSYSNKYQVYSSFVLELPEILVKIDSEKEQGAVSNSAHSCLNTAVSKFDI